MVAHEVQVMLLGFDRTGDVAKKVNDELVFSLANHGQILVCKFLEVWKDFGRLQATNARVGHVINAVQPLVDRIEVWPGLKTQRNTVLAHSYLIKPGDILTGPWDLLNRQQAPTFFAEIILLLQLVNFAVVSILCAFPVEYLPLRPLLTGARPQPAQGPGIRFGRDIQPILRAIVPQVDQRLATLGVKVGGEIAKEFIQAVTAAKTRWRRLKDWIRVRVWRVTDPIARWLERRASP